MNEPYQKNSKKKNRKFWIFIQKNAVGRENECWGCVTGVCGCVGAVGGVEKNYFPGHIFFIFSFL